MGKQGLGHKPIEEFIKFIYVGKSDSGKTEIWEVINTLRDESCGLVKWHGAWRKYCYFTDEGGYSDWDFMRYVADFLETKTLEHKANRL